MMGMPGSMRDQPSASPQMMQPRIGLAVNPPQRGRGEKDVRPGHESRLACHKNELTRVTRIFQKRAFTKAAHDARVGDRCGLFCRLGPDALEKWQPCRTHSVFANRGVLLFFIVIFYRYLREAIEVDRARTRPQVAGAELKGCGHARS
jgi:hypothetical protein